MSSLYILKIRSLSEVSLATMFSHTVGSLCILMLFSLPMHKLFYIDKAPFVYSFLYVPCFVSVRMLLCGMSEIFQPMFSSRTFMVLQLIFKSFIHLEFIFVCDGVGDQVSFFFT